ncbi:MAG TPA: ABC transporter [Rhodobacteraceae bacterium]|jgi:phospholipid transport system substrate-binding protein|nr:ABC transporter [Paracoccaceae bacterium]HBV55736.1 ABC transporter [Paracoccaceae bacterium]
MQSDVTRRFVILTGLAATVLPAPALALSEGAARTLVDGLVADINQVIASGKSEASMYGDFERIFNRYADVPTIARYALGADARGASAAQMSRFTKEFTRYISVKYGKRFREFIGGQIEVQGAKPVKSFIEVKTLAKLRGQAPFDVTFLVSDKAGSPLFFNMFIEGINMLLTERTEIGAMLDRRRGDIDGLIADLKTAG